MNNTQCSSYNGTYACKLPKSHSGAHQVTEYRRNSRNVVIFYVAAKWADSYGEVKFTKGFC